MEHATVDDDAKIIEVDTWLKEYVERATPVQRQELKEAMRRLTPVAVKTLMEITSESTDPELVEKSRELLEMIGPIRKGGSN